MGCCTCHPVTGITWVVFLTSVLAAMMVASGTNDDGTIIHWDYWFTIFKHISPYFWAALGVSIAIGMSVLGAAWCGSFASVGNLPSRNLFSSKGSHQSRGRGRPFPEAPSSSLSFVASLC